MSFLFNRFASRSMMNGLNRDMKKRAMASKSSVATTLYQNVWQKSTIMYITYIVVGCVAIEVVYGGVSNKIWEMSNEGVRS
jgi:hypothetical protein